MGPGQSLTGRLASPEPVQLLLEWHQLGVGGIDHVEAGADALAGCRAELHSVAGQPGPGLLGPDLALGHGDAVLEQLGVDALVHTRR